MFAPGERWTHRARARSVAGVAIAFLASVAALTTSGLASAQTAAGSGDDAAADQLFEEGRNLMEHGDYAAACPKLRASYAIDPAAGSLLALALCEERAGRVATATALYRDVVVRARAQRDADREAAAKARIEVLAPHVPRLRVTAAEVVATAPGLAWYVDGDRYEAVLLEGGAPFDPGVHVVEVRDAQGRSRRLDVTLERGQATMVTVDGWESAQPAPAPPPGAARATPAPASGTGTGLDGLQTAGLVVGGVGVIGLGIGTLFGILALGDTAGLDDRGTCDDVPDFDACAADYDAAKRDATISTIGLVGGGALAVAGITMFALGGGGSVGDDAALTVRLVGPTASAKLRF